MTIGFLIDSFPALSESFIHNQIIGMMEKGHEVYIFPKAIRKGEGWKIYEKYDLTHRFFLQEEKDESFGVKLSEFVRYYFRYNSDRTLLIKSLQLNKDFKQGLKLNFFWQIKPFVGKKLDLLFCHYGTNGNRAAELKSLGLNIPMLTMFHGYDIRLGIEEGAHIYTKQFETIDKVLSISEYNKEHLIGFGLEESKLIDHKVGIDIQQFNKSVFAKMEDKIIILSVGRLIKAKGYETSLLAIKELCKQYNSIEYRIIGEGIDEAYFRSIVKDFGLESKVKFLGGIPNHEIQGHFFEADIFLHASYAEALPVVLMEALMASLPVIATDVGSVKELISNNKTGLLIEPKDSEKIVKSVHALLGNMLEAKKMGERGKEFIIKNHNNKDLNDKLENILLELV